MPGMSFTPDPGTWPQGGEITFTPVTDTSRLTYEQVNASRTPAQIDRMEYLLVNNMLLYAVDRLGGELNIPMSYLDSAALQELWDTIITKDEHGQINIKVRTREEDQK